MAISWLPLSSINLDDDESLAWLEQLQLKAYFRIPLVGIAVGRDLDVILATANANMKIQLLWAESSIY